MLRFARERDTFAPRSEAPAWLGHARGDPAEAGWSDIVELPVWRAVERGRTNVAEPWLSADDIAAHLGVTKDTVYTWIAEKAMPAHKVGRLWKFQASEIDDWVRRGGASSSAHDEDAG